MSATSLKEKLESLTDWSKIFNFALYPIQDRETAPYKNLLERCRTKMKANGACEMPGFVTDLALALLQEESQHLEKQAFFKRIWGNAYLSPSDEALGPEHPINRKEDTNVGVVAYDQFPNCSLLKRIYEYEPLRRFVGDILELKEIYNYGDPMGALNLAVMRDADYLRWHFDQTDFVTSLAIQAAEEGGNFEYVPYIRSADDEHYDDVSKLLNGDRSRVVHLENKPGTLVLFMGRHSIHRVTPIRGSIPRWIGLFGYDSRPGVVSTPHLCEMRYGRQEPFATRPEF